MGVNIKQKERLTSAQIKFGTSGIVHAGQKINTFNIPKTGYNFIVRFELGEVAKQLVTQLHGTDVPLGRRVSFAVKDVDKPSFSMLIDTLNQYNKTRQNPGKITYDPVNMSLYDNVDSSVLLLIDLYRQYYYGDFSDKSIRSFQYDTISTPRMFEYEYPLVSSDLDQEDTNAAEDEANYTWGRSTYNQGDQDNGYFFKRIDIYEIEGSIYTVHNIHNPVIEAVGMGSKSHESEGEPQTIDLTFKHEGISNICPLTNQKAIAKPTAELLPIISPDDGEFSPMGFYKFWGELDDTPLNEYDPNGIKGFPTPTGNDSSATSILAKGVGALSSVDGLVQAATSGGGLGAVAGNVQSALGEGNIGSSAAGGISEATGALGDIGGLF